MKYKLIKENKILFAGSKFECYIWLLNNSGYTPEWALNEKGYKLIKI